ncbi:MAG: hypothetical protein Q8P67_16935, partial [archaeon]|nr:hypothetical protein [archaeon]
AAAEVAATKEALAAARMDVENARQALEALQQTETNLTNQIGDLMKQQHQAQAQVEEKQERISALESELENTRNILAELPPSAGGKSAEELAALEEAAQHLEALESEKNQLKEEIETLHGAIEDIQRQYQEEAIRADAAETRAAELEQRAVEAERKASSAASAPASGGSGGGDTAALHERIRELEQTLVEKSQDIDKLENEVEQWLVASEQLQALGEEAVKEVTEEAERLKEEVQLWQNKYEEQVSRRRQAEEELSASENKLNDLDSMFQRLTGGFGGV